MLLLQNIEGDSYNPILDNYLVVKVVNYADTAFNELESLLGELPHTHPKRVECVVVHRSYGTIGQTILQAQE